MSVTAPTTRERPRVVFVSYNALIEPLGASQVLPYVTGLSADYDISVLSFEKPVRSPSEDAATTAHTEAALRRHGIEWMRLAYHKRPSVPATVYDIACGVQRLTREHRRRAIHLVHARGYVPGAIALGLARRSRIPFVFDIRGLQAEEYADAGHWSPQSIPYRLTKHVERFILRSANGLVTLTDAIRPILRTFPGLRERAVVPPWQVIPSCVDLDHFRDDAEGRARVRRLLGVGDRPVLVYAGSVGAWYLVPEMLDFYQAARARWPELFFLALINREPAAVRDALAARGIPPSDFAVTWATHDEIPAYLSAADVGVAFIRACLSKRASSPTKYAEYLACGLPLVANTGVGDVDAIIGESGAGALVSAFTPEAYAAAADHIRHLVATCPRTRWRDVATSRFSVEGTALPRYKALYRDVLPHPAAMPMVAR